MTPDGYNPGAAEDPETNPEYAAREAAAEEVEPEPERFGEESAPPVL